ncbi:MAG: DsbA family protein [Anaerolineae bacterium]|nr:DsbA family protein [Anaerolineae bacterium]
MSKEERNVHNEDVIVLNKWTVIAVGVAILIFVLGGLGGYFLAKMAFDHALVEMGVQEPKPAKIETDGDPQIGPNNARVTIVSFSDFQCFYCKRFRDETLDALINEYGNKIRFVYRDYPLSSMHPEAQKSAEAAECANEQGKFWEMHDLLYANQESLNVKLYEELAEDIGLDMDKFTNCLDSDKYAEEVLADMQSGVSYGVSGTPTFFVNGQRLVGAQPLAEFKRIIDQELGN